MNEDEEFYDINNPDDARRYLADLERQGLLTYDSEVDESSEDLNDEDAIAIARKIFMRIHGKLKTQVQ